MKAKRAIDEINVDIGIPAALTGAFTAENLMRCYENEAAKILKDQGCPLTFAGLCRNRKKYLPDLANGRGTSPVYGIYWMLLGFNNVRVYLRNNNAEWAVCEMAFALHWASKMQIRPLIPLIDRGKTAIRGSSLGGIKKKTMDDSRHMKWRDDADAIRAKHPTFSPWRIAGDLVVFYKDNQTLRAKRDTIWRVIK